MRASESLDEQNPEDLSCSSEEDETDGLFESLDEKISSTGDPGEPRWRTTLITTPGDIRWIRQLNRKECIYYKAKRGDICHCGRSRDEHIAVDGVDSLGKLNGTWKKQNSLVRKETDTCGRIAYERDTLPSLFLRLDDRTSEYDLTYLVGNILQVTDNDLYVHFVDFEEDRPQTNDEVINKLQDKLSAGLKVLTEKTRVLLTSVGLQKGVSRHLHTALSNLHNHYSITPIIMACTNWGAVDEKDMFRDTAMEDHHDLKPGKRSDPNVLGENLSPYYTHYFFVDDGTYHAMPRHLHRFMEKLEMVFQKLHGPNGQPSVVILMNGGQKALDHVISALERNIPVIIVKGSGGYADQIASAYLTGRRRRRKTFDWNGSVSFKQSLNLEAFPNQDSKVRQILEHFDLITLFDPEPQTLGLDMVIVWSLLKAKQEDRLHKLLESFLKNNPGYSWQPSYTLNLENPQQCALNPHTYFMLEAMCNNSAAVVEAIMKGFNLKQQFTMDNIVHLYNRYDSLGPCRRFLREAKEKNSESSISSQSLTTLVDVRTALQDILGACYPVPCTGLGCQCQGVADPSHVSILMKDPNDFRSCLPPVQEMFLWALLTNKQRLAMMLWTWCEDKLASALVGEVVLRKLAEKEENVDNVTELKKDAEAFENLAVGMLKKCFLFDEESSHALLLRNTRWWGGKSCLQLAVQFSSKKFISQQACTSLLNKIWYGGISPYESPYKKTLACILAPIPCASLMLLHINKKDRTGFSLNDTKKENPSCQKLVLFYTAPVVKYTLNLMIFISFLMLFSYVLLVDLRPQFTLLQGVLCGFVATYLGEEIRQIYGVPDPSLWGKLSEYFRQFWNRLDVTMIACFIVGMLLVLVPGSGAAYEVRRVILNIDIFLFAMRLLQMFVVKKTLGPMLTMIQRMIGDTISFMIILLVFVLSYGVVSHSILYPQANKGWRLLYDVPRHAYWQIYGEFFLEKENIGETDTCSQNSSMSTYPKCSSMYIVEALLAVYAIITHVLLLNILIAKFNYTFAKVQGEASQIWAWHRCQIIHEFYTRPWIPPPFNIIYFVFWCVKYLIRKLIRRCRSCCNRLSQRPRTQRRNESSFLMRDCGPGKNAGVRIGKVDNNSIEIIWDQHQLREYDTYMIKYIKKINQNNPEITMRLCVTKACTVRDLSADSVYDFTMCGGCGNNDGSCSSWDDLCRIDIRTESDPEWEELSQLERDIVKSHLSMSGTNDLLLQRTEELSYQMTDLAKSCSTAQQTSAGTLEQLSKDVTQLRRDQTQSMNKLEVCLQNQDSELQGRVAQMETGLQTVQHNQDLIIQMLREIQSQSSQPQS